MSLLRGIAPCFKAGNPTEDDELSEEDRKEYTIKMKLWRYYELAFQTKKWTITASFNGTEEKGPEGDNHAYYKRKVSASAQSEITWKKQDEGGINPAAENATKQHEIVCCAPFSNLIKDEGTVTDTGYDDNGPFPPTTITMGQGTPTLVIQPGYYDKKTRDVYPHIDLRWSIATSVGGRRDDGPVPRKFKGAIKGSVDGIVLPMWASWTPNWEDAVGWTWSGAVSVVAVRRAF